MTMDEIWVHSKEIVIVYAGVILITWAFNILAVLIDLWTGIEKARCCGEKVHSHKLRETISKVGDYWRIQLFALMADMLGSLFWDLPYASIVTIIGIMAIEFWSVRENLITKKSAAAKVPEVVAKILSNAANRGVSKEALMAAIADQLESNKEK